MSIRDAQTWVGPQRPPLPGRPAGRLPRYVKRQFTRAVYELDDGSPLDNFRQGLHGRRRCSAGGVVRGPAVDLRFRLPGAPAESRDGRPRGHASSVERGSLEACPSQLLRVCGSTGVSSQDVNQAAWTSAARFISCLAGESWFVAWVVRSPAAYVWSLPPEGSGDLPSRETPPAARMLYARRGA